MVSRGMNGQGSEKLVGCIKVWDWKESLVYPTWDSHEQKDENIEGTWVRCHVADVMKLLEDRSVPMYRGCLERA